MELVIDPQSGDPTRTSLCLLCLGSRENQVVLGSSCAFCACSPDSRTRVVALCKEVFDFVCWKLLLNKEQCVPSSSPQCCKVSSLLNRRLRKKGRILMKLVSHWKPQARGQQRDVLKVSACTYCCWRPERVENLLTNLVF